MCLTQPAEQTLAIAEYIYDKDIISLGNAALKKPFLGWLAISRLVSGRLAKKG
jgi:hypothetical protein